MIIPLLLIIIISSLAYLAYERWTKLITISVVGLWVLYSLVLTFFIGTIVLSGFITGDLFVMFISGLLLFVSILMVLTLEPHKQIKNSVREINNK